MYVPRYLQVKGEDAKGGWAVDNRACANPEQFAQKFAGPLLDYCLSERNWTQIRYYSPINKPLYGGVFHHPRGDSFRAYAGMMASLRQELLDRDLVPQRLSLLAPSTPSVQDWPIPQFHSRGLDLDPLVEGYDQHEYFARFDGAPPNANAVTIPMTELIHRHLEEHVRYAREKNKAFLITELGHVYYGAGRGDPNGPATHNAFMLDAEFCVRAINIGVQGLLRWSFLNPGDIDGQWQFLQTADESDRRVTNTFYGYANLIRYVRPNSDVLATHVESSFYPWPHVYACSTRKPKGEFTLLVINDHDSEQVEATIKLPPALRQKPLNVIRTDRTCKHALVGHVRQAGKTSQFADKLPPRSLTAYTNLEHDDLRRIAGDTGGE